MKYEILTPNGDNLLDIIYPIGSFYTTTGNENPSTLFGGVWDLIEDRMLVGVGDTFLENEEDGSFVTATHTHTIPQFTTSTNSGGHKHVVYYKKKNNSDGSGDRSKGSTSHTHVLLNTTGSNHYHTILAHNTEFSYKPSEQRDTSGRLTDVSGNFGDLTGGIGSNLTEVFGTFLDTYGNLSPVLVVNIWKRIS